MLSLSDILGYASIGCWLGAQFPQVIENIKLQSCEGLALPFLANWLLGDISNLVGCILTHQLPFQTWLATYFVFVDFTLVAQYMYYYKAPKVPPSVLGRIRSATSPGAIRRMSIDRGASRYRTLSAVASNVAAAAALAAQQDEQADSRRANTRHPRRTGRRLGYERSSSLASAGMGEEGESDPPPAMMDSFHSEGGRDVAPKRVSWSIERHRGRASSVGQTIRSTTPTPALNIISNESPAATTHPDALHNERRDSNLLISSTESLSPVINSRSSRASRKGSTMVFLGAWALFGFGTLTNDRHGIPSTRLSNVGRVLSTSSISIAFTEHGIYSRDKATEKVAPLGIRLPSLVSDISIENEPQGDPHPDEPSPEQVLGRIFAWLCTTLYLTSRLPQIWKNYARKSVEGLSMYLFVFAFLGNSFYASSILVSPRRFLPPPESTQYIRESIPYLLGSVGTLMFDITIVAQSFIYRPRHRRHSTTHSRVLDEEEAGLLSGDALSAHPPGDSAILNRGRTSPTYRARGGLNSTPSMGRRSLVLDYLCHSCYTNTARAFNRDSTIRHLDADGDEIVEPVISDGTRSSETSSGSGPFDRFERFLKQVELRQEIRNEILSGRVDEAIALLNEHFPAVLSEDVVTKASDDAEPRPSTSNIEYISSTSTEPAHLLLNLRILAFSEACRTIPLDYPPKSEVMERDSRPAASPSEPEDSPDYLEQQMALLARAQKLYAFSNMLPNPADRATYLKELENVGGLLAYKVPEKSSMAKYLTLERREAVADQLNRAILKRTGRQPVSTLELLTRYTHLLWQAAHQHGVKARPGAVLPPKSIKVTSTTEGESEV
ncbi:hypothetical protein GALMADRAFT_58600 [Galerina marginata CBS 339.88]|uniref:CRA domain-containing protein n=1 Tax=Galerina marginata (strain CBS 339.88) TaxID=685588 RepID=A0A067TEU9_GALM3|nr:hypothetical protein GALMADRAFT_58600 [Galerina marginata CBS 339.88]